MRRTKRNATNLMPSNFFKVSAVAFALLACWPVCSTAQQQGQRAYSSPEDAVNALIIAAQNNDEKAMLDVLGPDGEEIVSSGDAVEDTQTRANFVQRYQEMHRLVKEPNGHIMLYIGAMNWPAPIPLVSKGKEWYFDTEAGKKEILYRRIGRNEISTIHVCRELAAAEKEYYSTQHNGYAQQIFSDEGQHNGLYWKAAEGEPQSPIGPRVASANAEGYKKGANGPRTPYRGYYYRVLLRQGKNAPGGAKSYVVNGKMTEGFAFLAYPADYRSSGVMTFIVGSDGVVYQRDLGKKTYSFGIAMKDYNPDSNWQKAEEEQTNVASEQKPK